MSPITDTFWPTLKAQLLHPDTTIRDCSVACTICYENVELEHDVSSDEPAHTAVVLPCGHIFGSSCLGYWTQSLVDRGTTPSCPTCRRETIHSACEHYARPLHIPLKHRQVVNDGLATTNVAKAINTFVNAIDGFLESQTTKEMRRRDFLRLPPTIPEGGGVNDLCYSCHVEDLLSTMTALTSSVPNSSVNLAPDEFIGVAATLGDGMWRLYSHERRQHATIRRGLGRHEGSLKACRRLESLIEQDCCRRWYGRDLRGIRFSFQVYAWE
ncbi:hypothetical protein CEP54_008244 [Fusarium duplospermum]|uniref:RING-type domain-containing protein n=1 Tax=Fusarium duplospermum TaxID=1325734 RepID=A0A428PWX6_9HYPO|nr:hypothetical protein CEP54_008244 [Fusarium duplospermum]